MKREPDRSPHERPGIPRLQSWEGRQWEWNGLIRVHLGFPINRWVRIVNRTRDEMASNWESLEENEDPNLPEDVRNRALEAVEGLGVGDELPSRDLQGVVDHAGRAIQQAAPALAALALTMTGSVLDSARRSLVSDQANGVLPQSQGGGQHVGEDDD